MSTVIGAGIATYGDLDRMGTEDLYDAFEIALVTAHNRRAGSLAAAKD